MEIGGEFEFVDPTVEVIPGSGLKGHEAAMAERMVESVRQTCGSACTETVIRGKWGLEHRFQLENGFWFQVSWDPNVVEITTKPTSVAGVREIASMLQKLIWESAASAGLAPDPEHRAGHFNFSALGSFDKNPAEFLKFFIDFANRPELATGIFRDSNLLNSPHLSQLSIDQRHALTQVVQDFRSQQSPELAMIDSMMSMNPFLQVSKHPSKMDLSELAEYILNKVLYKSTKPQHTGMDAWHYQALGLKSLVGMSWYGGKDRPVEIRSVRSQRDIYDFILMAELMEARIQYLKTLPPEIAFHVSETARSQFSQQELVDRFYIYVKEAGLSWKRYQRLLPPKLVKLKPHALLSGKVTGELVKDMAEFRKLIDLAPTSPWMQKKLQDILQSPELPDEQRSQILTELQRLSGSEEYSVKSKEGFLNLLERHQSARPIGGSCRQIFL